MNDPFFCASYGSITQEDALVMEETLLALMPKNPVTVLEIGCYKGGTANGICKFLGQLGVKLVYYGIDAGLITHPVAPFDGATVIHARSEDAARLVPDGWDVIFVDGCHCRKCVILDTQNYAPKVRLGGFMVYHDCSPMAQGKDLQPCGTATDVIGALDAMRWPHQSWRLFLEKFNPDLPFGGTRSYQRTA